MSLSIPVVWTDRHRLHEPGGEIWVGVRTPGTETPARAERIREELAADGARFVEPTPHPDAYLERTHDRALLDYLAAAWHEWEAAGLTVDPGQDRVVPYLFPHPGLFAGVEPARAAAASARAGQFAFDTMTLIGPGTWQAARAGADAALTAVDLALGGEPVVYACCRPPGHHVTRSCFGGSCYLNNAAIGAAELRAASGGQGRDRRHRRPPRQRRPGDLLCRSRCPHRLGARRSRRRLVPALSRLRRRDRKRRGGGEQSQPAARPGQRRSRLARRRRRARRLGRALGAQALVVALGVDAAGGDPESPLQVSAEGYRAAGRALGALGLPTVIVQEGGYRLETVGSLVRAALAGFGEGVAATAAT